MVSDMFLRSTIRNKDGKLHRYYSVVENRRLTSGKVVQRTVLYLGEINDSQEAAWRKTLEVFDESTKGPTMLSLFPEDREIPADAVDAVQVKLSAMELRRPERQLQYLVGTPRGRIGKMEKQWLELPWQKVRDSVEVKLWTEGSELFVLAKSEGRRAKEMAMRRRRLVQYLRALRRMRHSLPSRDQLMMRVGAAKSKAGRAASFVPIRLPAKDEAVTRETFRFRLDREKLDKAELRDGHYLLRSNVTAGNPEVLWQRYVQLTEIEAVFKALKSDLAVRPIHHQREQRVEAHIFVAFVAYCLMVTLKKRLQLHAPGLTPKAVLERLATIQMLDVWLPTTDGRYLTMSRYTQPETDQAIILQKLGLQLPAQPPPRINSQPSDCFAAAEIAGM